MNDELYDIAVIGAGASGMMAAIRAAEFDPGLKIAVLEKNAEPCKKIYATGNGRCNYLNRNAKPEDYFSCERSGSVPELCESVVSELAVPAMIDEFKLLGIEPVEEDEGRMYPRSGQARSIVKALVRGAVSNEVKIICDFDVSSVEKSAYFTIKSRSGRSVDARRVILACAGKAGIQYGCSGDGYKIASYFGHTIVKPIPALTSLNTSEDMTDIFGIRAKGRIALISCKDGVQSVESEDSGEIQFTRDGISGICTFNVSRFFRIKEGVKYKAEIDLFEGVSDEELTQMLLQRRDIFAEESASELLGGMLPDKLGEYIIKRAGIRPSMPIRMISAEKISFIVLLCKSLIFDITGTKGFKDAQVTAGGVSCSEIDPAHLESLKVHGLYFAGEIIDVDGLCGGYNLTWAFASGFIAGLSAAKSLND